MSKGVERVLRLTEKQIKKAAKTMDKMDEVDAQLVNAFGKLLNNYSRLLEQAGLSKASDTTDEWPTIHPETGYVRGSMRQQ
jgi:hypothetical protein